MCGCERDFVVACLFACLMSQQHASVPQGRRKGETEGERERERLIDCLID